MSVNFRRAIPGDCHALLELIRAHAAYEQSVAMIEQDQLGDLLVNTNPPSCIIVAEENGNLLGYAALTLDYGLWSGAWYAHMDCLFVLAAQRRRGLGAGLVAYAKEVARERGALRMEWQTPSWNTSAIGFYARLGASGAQKLRFTMPIG